MKILCVADIHGDDDSIVYARNYVIENGIDCVFLMGDYSVGFKDPAQNLIDIEYALDFLRDDAILYAIPGNCDQKKAIEVIEGHEMSLHDKVVELDGVSFIGLGGSNPTPFETPIEYSEEEIYSKLDALFRQAKTGKIVLVTHFPPKDTKCDRIPSGAHVGSSSLRKIIEEKKPAACVCSHIHESAGGQDFIEGVKIVNVGMLSHGNAVLVESEPLSVKHLKLR